MNAKWIVMGALAAGLVGCKSTGSNNSNATDHEAAQPAGWQETFSVDKADLQPTGNNKYLPVQPGRVIKMSNGKDTLTVTILNETETVDGVKAAVLEERETKNGALEEVSRNFLATDKNTGDVYYLGEDVDNYKAGKVINHDSQWRAGRDGARFGMMVPAKPHVGQKFYQEFAPKVAMDRVEIVSTDETVKTQAGTFKHCIHFKETTPVENEVSHKYFAPGIGMVKDDDFEISQKP